MTLNIPTYTMSAKIYKTIYAMLKQVQAEELEQKRISDQEQTEDKVEEQDAEDINFTDIFVQSQLKEILRQLFPKRSGDEGGGDDEGASYVFKSSDLEGVELICAGLNKHT